MHLNSFLWYSPWKRYGCLFLPSLASLVIPYLTPRTDVVLFVQYPCNSHSSLEKHSSCTLQCSCRKHAVLYINCAMDVKQDLDCLLVIYICKHLELHCSRCAHCVCISTYILKKDQIILDICTCNISSLISNWILNLQNNLSSHYWWIMQEKVFPLRAVHIAVTTFPQVSVLCITFLNALVPCHYVRL